MPSTQFAEVWLEGPKSTKFYTRTYPGTPTPKAVVIFIHGFAEHVGRYTHFHPKIAEKGITVFTFDQRGFGRTGQDTEHRSKGMKYGKSGWTDQMADDEWAIQHVKKEFPGLPIFIMGQSMGGGEVLSFATLPKDSPHHATVSSLAGVIATSPLIEQTKPVSKLLRRAGEKLALLFPYMLFPAEVPAEDLTHDAVIVEAVQKDPLVQKTGSLRGLADMLNKGEELKHSLHKNWPATLPVLFLHGSEDKVTSPKATQDFHDKIVTDKKKIVIFEGAYHELQNETDGFQEKAVDEIDIFVTTHIMPSSEAPAVVVEADTAGVPASQKSNL